MRTVLTRTRFFALLPAVLLLAALLTSPAVLSVGVVNAGTAGSAGSTTEYYSQFVNNVGPQQAVRVMLHLPPNASARQPLPILVALHGYGGNGASFARPLLEAADRLGWAVIAPSITYRDWHDPVQVCEDARDDLPGLRAWLNELPTRTGLRYQPRVMLYGFSRGAQYAHRFALAYPEMVASVAAVSAGTYTLPQTVWVDPDGARTTLNMPYGAADLQTYTGQPFREAPLRQVRFLIGVGSTDHQAGDVPRSWDKYIGDCRVDRANSFVASLRQLGVPVELRQFPNTQHEETAEMRAAALQFLAVAPDPIQVASR